MSCPVTRTSVMMFRVRAYLRKTTLGYVDCVILPDHRKITCDCHKKKTVISLRRRAALFQEVLSVLSQPPRSF